MVSFISWSLTLNILTSLSVDNILTSLSVDNILTFRSVENKIMKKYIFLLMSSENATDARVIFQQFEKKKNFRRHFFSSPKYTFCGLVNRRPWVIAIGFLNCLRPREIYGRKCCLQTTLGHWRQLLFTNMMFSEFQSQQAHDVESTLNSGLDFDSTLKSWDACWDSFSCLLRIFEFLLINYLLIYSFIE
jgi:hypothetical protein